MKRPSAFVRCSQRRDGQRHHARCILVNKTQLSVLTGLLKVLHSALDMQANPRSAWPLSTQPSR